MSIVLGIWLIFAIIAAPTIVVALPSEDSSLLTQNG